MSISIVLAEDHTIIRKGLKALLERDPQYRIVGEAEDGLETLRVVEQLQPDILILDLMMPKLSGVEVAHRVPQVSARTKTIVLTMHADEAYVSDMLYSGVAGYILKDAPSEELFLAIEQALKGEQYLCSALSIDSIHKYLNQVYAAGEDLFQRLSPREIEVLRLAAEGLTNAEVAERLSIGIRTVETHRKNFMHKLGLKSQTELVRYALKKGIIQ